MNKFEQASSDHHQMSLVWRVGPKVWCAGGEVGPQIWSGGGVGPEVWCDLSYDAFDITYSESNKQTDPCENITFTQLHLQAVK